MRRVWVLLMAVAAGASTHAPAADYRSTFNPSRLKAPAAATPNEVLVLGTPHLSGFPETFDARTLAPLLDRLAKWRPRIITVEALSGAQCDQLRRYSARYSATVASYCPDTAAARAATGLDVVAATEAADRLLASWPAAPAPAQRRHLAAVFLAAGDGTSALVQWLRLAPAERREGDGLDTMLVTRLELLRQRRNENYLIAAALAARLGLERVFPVDDHSADFAVGAEEEEAFGAALKRIWDNPASGKRQVAEKAISERLGTGEGVLAAYRIYNAPEQAQLAFDGDFGAALRDTSPQGFGRRYLTSWETRNLRMVANIRDTMGKAPGGRVLAIVGASHKGYFEAYLEQMHDVQLVDAVAVLR